jgi:hypothetical protein
MVIIESFSVICLTVKPFRLHLGRPKFWILPPALAKKEKETT